MTPLPSPRSAVRAAGRPTLRRADQTATHPLGGTIANVTTAPPRRRPRGAAATHHPRIPGRYLQRLELHRAGGVEVVEVAHIDWLEAAGKHIEVHIGGSMLRHRERLHVLERQLPPTELVRIHRSIIVQRAAVKELRPLPGGDYSVFVRTGASLRLSRTYRAALDLLSRPL